MGMDYSHKALREWRKGRRLTQQEIADQLGITRCGYANYEAGTAPIPADRIEKLKSLGFGGSNVDAVEARASGSAKLPYIGMVAASEKVAWTDPIEVDTAESVPADMAKGPGRFTCRVMGDSMYDLLWPDDLCVFQSSPVPKIGAVVLFRADQGHITIKQLKHDGQGFILHPLNSSYQDEPAMGMPIGFLVGIVRVEGSRTTIIYDSSGIKP